MDFDTTEPLSSTGFRKQVLDLKTIVSATALASILDPDQAHAHARETLRELQVGLDRILELRNSIPAGWETNTPFGSFLFSGILALDVINPYITPEERNDIALYFEELVPTISNIWRPSGTSVRTLWAIYKDPENTSGYRSGITTFLNELESHVTEDGVMVAGTGYANARLNYYDRKQKNCLTEIIQRLGTEVYSRPKLQKAYEWLYGYAFGHNGEVHVFGDTSTDRPLFGPPGEYPVNSPGAAYRAWRFSPAAQSYANFLLSNIPGAEIPLPTLLNYFGWTSPSVETQAASAGSRIFPDGGAYFRERTIESDGLSASLWNLDGNQTDSHTHKDTNAISIIGLGEHLISNSGYAGWRSGIGGFTWNDINDRAASNNTALIDYPITSGKNLPSIQDHGLKYGRGIPRGILSDSLDYAVGDSGSALSGGTHFRGMGLVHPEEDLPPYVFLLDRIESDTGTTAHLAFHPFSDDPNPEVKPDEHYRWFIQSDTPEGAYLSIYPGKAAQQVQILDGVFANLTRENTLFGTFLYTTYPIMDGQSHVATVLFPHRTLADAPTSVNQLSGDHYHGVRISLNDQVTDLLLSMEVAAHEVTLGPFSLRASGAYIRTRQNEVHRFFLDQGTRFTHAGTTLFESTVPITLVVDQQSARLSLSEPGEVLFRMPGVTQTYVNQNPEPIPVEENTGLLLQLEAGTHHLTWNEPAPSSVHLNLSGETLHLQAKNLLPGKIYSLLASSDLSQWDTIGTFTASTLAHLETEPMGSFTHRFFQLKQN